MQVQAVPQDMTAFGVAMFLMLIALNLVALGVLRSRSRRRRERNRDRFF